MPWQLTLYTLHPEALVALSSHGSPQRSLKSNMSRGRAKPQRSLKSTMARGRAKQQKHRFSNDIQDIVLQPKTTPPRPPLAWADDEDGELSPIFAVEDDHIGAERQSRKVRRRLRQQKLCLPSPFLKLPVELRIIIYRYALTCALPIDHQTDSCGKNGSNSVF